MIITVKSRRKKKNYVSEMFRKSFVWLKFKKTYAMRMLKFPIHDR